MLIDIQKSLEAIFEMPFSVERKYLHGYPCVVISPKNDGESLFEVSVYFKDEIRIVLEISPQRFASDFIQEISNAGDEKRNIASLYFRTMLTEGSKIEFVINGNIQDPCDYESWPQKWTNYSCRITKIPVYSRGPVENNTEIVTEWASKCVGLFMSLLNVEIVERVAEKEGASYNALVKKYERSRVNRELCLMAKGYSCSICGFNFEEQYGIIGRRFIHVHHVVPVSRLGGSYKLDPTKDLIPICPNCHSMLHRQDPPLLPHQLIEIRKQNASTISE